MPIVLTDLRILQGANFSHVFNIDLEDSEGDPLDLTDFTGHMEARAEAGSDSILAEFSVTIDEEAHTALAELTAAETEVMNWSCGVYDLVLVSSGSDVYRVAQGDITLNHQVTVLV